MTRVRMQMRLADAVPPASATQAWTIRPVRGHDREPLAALMLEAYRGTVDDEGETLEGAREEVRRTFEGDYGAFLSQFSILAEDGDRMIGASLITLWEGRPFVAFTMTHPDAKNRGLATALMSRSIELLWAAGHDELRLIVTEGNDSAIHVYKKLGFRPEL
jgi:ribosomal protein S18 acetylase RimI-like enzyme